MGTGTTPRCAYCGRPIINSPTAYGHAGEVYHFECTLPPQSVQGHYTVEPKITRDDQPTWVTHKTGK